MNIGVMQLQMLVEEFERRKVVQSVSIQDIDFTYCDYMENSNIPDVTSSWKQFNPNTLIEGSDRHFWIHFNLDLEKCDAGIEHRLKVSTGHRSGWDAMNPQMLMYLDRTPLCGIDANHQELFLPAEGKHEVHIYAHTGMAEAKFPLSVSLLKVDVNAEQLYFDLKTAYDSCICLGEESEATNKITSVVKKAAMLLDLRNVSEESYSRSVLSARKYLDEHLYEPGNSSFGKPITCIGHTHIDVAWLWTLAQTREKVQRSFSTVLYLMERYPEYKFMSSQPQLYKYLKETQPEMYRQIKAKVEYKSWEPEGALWLESDCNNTSGESLIRQIMYGKRFFRSEFGVESKVAWLPDVFGFCGALPQILKKCGVEHFVTSKLSWNETDKMPYDTFYWQGIDGSRVFTNLIASRACPIGNESDIHTDYNAKITPTYALGTYKRYQHKEYNDELFIPFGWGDGGGGATKEMLETQRRLSKGIPGIPRTVIASITDYLDRVKETFDRNCAALKHTPEWYGELYFELHRGTYTSMAKNKKYNRASEFAQLAIEGLYAILSKYLPIEYPHAALANMWETILLNQFHDILPGSAIKKVYDDSEQQYLAIQKSGDQLIAAALKKLGENINCAMGGVLVYNPNSFVCSDYVICEGKHLFAENVPAFGWKVISPEQEMHEFAAWKEDQVLDTPYYTVRFDASWNIASLFDKAADRELIRPGESGNRIEVYENYPYNYDAWEISEYYADKVWYMDAFSDVTKYADNGVAGVIITRKFNKSVFVQRIKFYEHKKRIDFETEVDWNEDKLLVKAAFPWNLYTHHATFDIPFGSLERPTYANTSWDQAKFEVNGHKWVDLSEANYGIVLLNDCKYGHSVSGATVKLSLLTSPLYPNPAADRGLNQFTYAVLPHENAAILSDTIQNAYSLNQRMRAVSIKPHSGVLENEFSAIKCSSDTVIIETVKKPEQGEGIVIRMYQSARVQEYFELETAFDITSAYLTSMLEEIESEVQLQDNKIRLQIKPFEIITLLVR